MLKLLKELNKKDCFFAFISFILIIVQVWLELKMPDYMSEITKLVQTKGALMSDILTQGGYMLLCAFGSLVSAIIVGYLISNTVIKNSNRCLNGISVPKYKISCSCKNSRRSL